MDLRSYSVALISVIVGLGLTSLLGAFNRLMRRRREICWNALPLAWALIALLLIINYWWGIYLGAVAATTPSSAYTFLLSLSAPILLYLICAAALPDPRVLRTDDLLAAYFAESRYFFALVLLYIVLTGVGTALHDGAFKLNPHMWMRFAIIGVCIPLLWTRRVWLHWLAAGVVLTIITCVLFETALH